MTSEIWAPIPGYEGRYEVSNLGRVKSLQRSITALGPRGGLIEYTRADRILKPICSDTGYDIVNLFGASRRGRKHYVHRLVALAFLGPCPGGKEVCHNDGNRTNNALSNLRYDTRKANQADRVTHGTDTRLSLNPESVAEIRGLSGVVHINDLAARYGVTAQTIASVQRRRTWKGI